MKLTVIALLILGTVSGFGTTLQVFTGGPTAPADITDNAGASIVGAGFAAIGTWDGSGLGFIATPADLATGFSIGNYLPDPSAPLEAYSFLTNSADGFNITNVTKASIAAAGDIGKNIAVAIWKGPDADNLLTATEAVLFEFDQTYDDAATPTAVNYLDGAGTLLFGVSKTQLNWFLPPSSELHLDPSTNGIIEGAGIYDPGEIATITATADPGYLFVGWTGDASGSENPLAVPMNSDKTIGAIFEPDLGDDDGDGLTNYQEIAVYGTRPDLDDTDGDGLTDAYEVGVGRYSLVTGGFTWPLARIDAEGQGGHLATFTSQEEWDIALNSLGTGALDGVTGAWIGATDMDEEGTWTWITGEPFTFDVWALGQPDDFNNSDVAEVGGGFGAAFGKWLDTGASVFREGYILEIYYATDPTVADVDGDGLNDSEEQAAGSHPFLADTDGDGLIDWQEVHLTLTNPAKDDTDGNGTPDGEEDFDTDGLDNLTEVNVHGTNPRAADSDNDGVIDSDELNYDGSTYALIENSFTWAQAMEDARTRGGRVAVFPNGADYTPSLIYVRAMSTVSLWIGLSDAGVEGTWIWNDGSPLEYNRWLVGQPDGGAAENQVVISENEMTWEDVQADFVSGGYLFEYVGLNPNNPDSDGDGLTDGREINTEGTSPVDADTDRDGLLDGEEVNTHGSDPLEHDSDGDGLDDYTEVIVHGSNPSLADTDGDGYSDGFEVNSGFDPTSHENAPDSLSSIHIAVEFRFSAAAGETYRIEGSDDLENWTIIEDGIAGTGGQISRFYPTEGQGFKALRARKN